MSGHLAFLCSSNYWKMSPFLLLFWTIFKLWYEVTLKSMWNQKESFSTDTIFLSKTIITIHMEDRFVLINVPKLRMRTCLIVWKEKETPTMKLEWFDISCWYSIPIQYISFFVSIASSLTYTSCICNRYQNNSGSYSLFLISEGGIFWW